jgi:hypothetical protein
VTFVNTKNPAEKVVLGQPPLTPSEIDTRDSAQDELSALAARADTYFASNDNTLATIQQATELANGWSTGYGAWALDKLPATDARKLRGLVTTIKANIGFDRLQRMRDESKTGGALGQVAIQELDALQNSIANLDTANTAEDFKSALGKVAEHYQRARLAFERMLAEKRRTLAPRAQDRTAPPPPPRPDVTTNEGGTVIAPGTILAPGEGPAPVKTKDDYLRAVGAIP